MPRVRKVAILCGILCILQQSCNFGNNNRLMLLEIIIIYLGMNYICCPGDNGLDSKELALFLKAKSHKVFNLLRIIQCCCFCCCFGSEICFNKITNYCSSSVAPKRGISGKIYKNNEMCRINFYL